MLSFFNFYTSRWHRRYLFDLCLLIMNYLKVCSILTCRCKTEGSMTSPSMQFERNHEINAVSCPKNMGRKKKQESKGLYKKASKGTLYKVVLITFGIFKVIFQCSALQMSQKCHTKRFQIQTSRGNSCAALVHGLFRIA